MSDQFAANRPLLPDQFDVIVVGAGAAGLYTALCLPAHYTVALISKDDLARSASDWAQGGIAAVVDPQDSTALHIADTLKAGAGLCDYAAVKFLVENAATCINALVDIGVAFDRHGPDLALTLEAAHSRRRVLHAADTTGRAIVTTLMAEVLTRRNVQVISQAFVLELWQEPLTQICRGVSLVYQRQVQWLRAKAVILATGGGGQAFAQTTNPLVSTGDGVAIAHRAGAVLRDLEFMQFHPTALTKVGAPRFLISEAVRGEGAHLVDRQGYRFAFDYHPAGELAPRDIVSRAIFNHLQQTESDPARANVWLDLRPISAATIQQRFPNIIQVCQQWGIDVFQSPIPVAPAAHYWMGGIVTDQLNRTTIAGLYAVGETASTGVHGANRLASNSLLECLVFGAQLAHLELPAPTLMAMALGRSPLGQAKEIPFNLLPAGTILAAVSHITRLRQALPRLVWQAAGICRDQATLEQAIAQVAIWQQEFNQLALTQALRHLPPATPLKFAEPDADKHLRAWGELHNLLAIASLLLKSAQFRTESRGGHYRSDYPQPLDAWQAHTLVQADQWWQAAIDPLT